EAAVRPGHGEPGRALRAAILQGGRPLPADPRQPLRRGQGGGADERCPDVLCFAGGDAQGAGRLPRQRMAADPPAVAPQRAAVALCRFGGLRCPSELMPLRWDEVNWERGRFLVHSPKTEHHEGGRERWVPIFPELRPYLEDAFERAEPGTVYMVNRHRDTNAN